MKFSTMQSGKLEGKWVENCELGNWRVKENVEVSKVGRINWGGKPENKRNEK
ncbi:hypothetical protein WN51_14533 [Melipona quadrifasciata]|uniref:Uncharacterized protein n=1 Tax=Melipona quadrifasciata TaxID=166423 RepID=A0A0M8ZYF9_9HYME|nr:hypothetical protein WN51_14533 [Melipona quadrifasciata]